jgi:hypothetical protein
MLQLFLYAAGFMIGFGFQIQVLMKKAYYQPVIKVVINTNL